MVVMTMRDTRKTEAYFDDYIAYEKERIQKKTEKLTQCDDEAKAQRISSSLFLYQMNLLIASFSKGADETALTVLFQDCCHTAQRMTVLPYEDALRMASFSVLLKCPTEFQKVAEQCSEVFEEDRLLKGLCSFAVSGKAVWEGEYRFPSIYAGMEDVLTAQEKQEKEKALLCYLSGWYGRNKESAWYGTLNSANDVYYGYWSFESAAIAAIYELNQKYLAQNEYFPKL